MAPRRKKSNGTAPIINEPDGQRYQEVTTSRGVKVKISAAPPLMQAALKSAIEIDWEERGKTLPTVPTYTIKTAAGVVETHEHDEQTAKGSPDAQAAWDSWLKGKAEFESELREQFIRSLILDCVEFTEDRAWDAKNKAKKVKVPADEYERKLFYAYTSVFMDPSDYTEIMVTSARLAGATEQQINAVREAFRHPLGKSGRPKPAKPDSEAGQVVA